MNYTILDENAEGAKDRPLQNASNILVKSWTPKNIHIFINM